MSDKQVSEIVIALGSNHDAEAAFACATDALSQLGKVMMSDIISGRDFTGRSKRIYHNSCAYIVLTQTVNYTDIEIKLKTIERLCGRDPAKKCAEYDYQVAMDLDILAVCVDGKWQPSSARLPFKNYDLQGLRQVAAFLLD